ncbi:MAG: hydantoinase/oxoprolinase N-terminal domain-containing protein [Gluconobacter potus]
MMSGKNPNTENSLSTEAPMVRIGIDVGGTLTDFPVSEAEGEELSYFKTPSTPHDPSEAILTGIRTILATRGIAAGKVAYLGHGITVATNMIIEGNWVVM